MFSSPGLHVHGDKVGGRPVDPLGGEDVGDTRVDTLPAPPQWGPNTLLGSPTTDVLGHPKRGEGPVSVKGVRVGAPTHVVHGRLGDKDVSVEEVSAWGWDGTFGEVPDARLTQALPQD